MKCYITTTSFGFIATNQENKIIEYQLFTNNEVSVLQKIEKKEITSEEIELINTVSKKYDEIIIETRNNKNSYKNLGAFDKIQVKTTTNEGKFIRENFDTIIEEIPELNDINTKKELNKIYQIIAKEKIRESIKTNDVMIIETINSLEEIEETTGKFIERLREWCTPYLPELEKIHNHELYTEIIATQTKRENIKNCELLQSTNVKLSETYDIEMKEADLIIIKEFAESLLKLYETKNKLETYIQEKIETIAPNLNDVAGANLSAKLIAHMNGLEELAKLPSSTIQIIGAEKAIFRHLKTGENPPKHGLIYQHPHIRGSNWWVRGKLARAIAGKIAIAARKDAFSNEYDPKLREDLDDKVEKIKKDNPFPERKNKRNKKEEKNDKKNKKNRKKNKRNKKKLRKGEYPTNY